MLPPTISIHLSTHRCIKAVGLRLCEKATDGTPGWFCVEHNQPVAIHAGKGYSVPDGLTEGRTAQCTEIKVPMDDPTILLPVKSAGWIAAERSWRSDDLEGVRGRHARGMQDDSGDVFMQLLSPRPVQRLPRQQPDGPVRRPLRLLRAVTGPITTTADHAMRLVRSA